MKFKVSLIIWTGFLLVSNASFALNKCVDNDGKVTFQDKACESHQESSPLSQERDSDSIDSINTQFVNIAGIGEAILHSYKWWDVEVIQPGKNLPATVKMRSKVGEEPLSLSMTFFPNKNNRKISLQESADTVYKIGSRYVDSSIEQEVNLEKFDTTLGPAVLASFNEKKYIGKPIPDGEYSSITVGQVAHSKVIVAITILTNGSDSPALTEALNIIGSFYIVPNKNNT